jgi:hypothetical protein
MKDVVGQLWLPRSPSLARSSEGGVRLERGQWRGSAGEALSNAWLSSGGGGCMDGNQEVSWPHNTGFWAGG